MVEKPDFALVLPRCRDGFRLVEQFRCPVGRRAWEFRQGSWGQNAGRDLVALALDIYLATELEEGAPDRQAREQDMIHRVFSDVGTAGQERPLVEQIHRAAPSLTACDVFTMRISPAPNSARVT